MAKNVLVSDAQLEITQIKSAIGGKQLVKVEEAK